MKKFVNLLLLGGLLFGGCHEITVGYLYTDEASYPINELEIYNIPARIKVLEENLAKFTEQSAGIQQRYDELNTVYLQNKQVLDMFYKSQILPLEDTVTNILKPGLDDKKIADLKDKLENELYPRQRQMIADLDEIQAALSKSRLELEKLADELKVPSPLQVKKEIEELNFRIKYNSPWTTSEMQGIMGTEPLIYEIVGVENADSGNAVKFSTYLEIRGGGRLYVSQDVDVPAGKYTVSVKVSNEGRSKVFPGVFTFIVTK